MNAILTKLRKGIQRRLSAPDSLFWKFDGQDRGGSPHRVFLDLNYHGKTAVIEWQAAVWRAARACSRKAQSGDNFRISLLEDDATHDYDINGITAAIDKVIELLEPPKLG